MDSITLVCNLKQEKGDEPATSTEGKAWGSGYMWKITPYVLPGLLASFDRCGVTSCYALTSRKSFPYIRSYKHRLKETFISLT